jgi:hypothetical protein
MVTRLSLNVTLSANVDSLSLDSSRDFPDLICERSANTRASVALSSPTTPLQGVSNTSGFGVVLVPSSSNVYPLVAKGQPSDVGLLLDPTAVQFIPVAPNQPLYLTASRVTAVTVETIWI